MVKHGTLDYVSICHLLCPTTPRIEVSLRQLKRLNTKPHQGQVRSKLLQNFGQQGRLFETCNMLVKLLDSSDSGHVLKVRIGHEVPARKEHYKNL